MQWYLACLKKYVTFAGRARRTEYWMFCLINFLISFAIGFIGGMLGSPGIMLLSNLYQLAVLLPGLAVFVRRMHDTGRSGWWFWLLLIPLVGAIVVLVFLCQDSQQGENKYGPNPKA